MPGTLGEEAGINAPTGTAPGPLRATSAASVAGFPSLCVLGSASFPIAGISVGEEALGGVEIEAINRSITAAAGSAPMVA